MYAFAGRAWRLYESGVADLVIRLTVCKAVELRFAPITAICLRCADSCIPRVLVRLKTGHERPSMTPAFNHWRSLGIAAVSLVLVQLNSWPAALSNLAESVRASKKLWRSGPRTVRSSTYTVSCKEGTCE